jgi:hypothetical protein
MAEVLVVALRALRFHAQKIIACLAITRCRADARLWLQVEGERLR